MGNFAYIDNQNLYMATSRAPVDPWDVDMKRLRVFLREKYDVEVAYLFMGSFDDRKRDLYARFQQYGYILMWRPHVDGMLAAKKGNVDTDVVFQMMYDTYESEGMDGAVLVSGDGDYWRTVEYLLDKGKLKKVLLPSRRNASSLYKALTDEYRVYLDTPSARKKFGRKQ